MKERLIMVFKRLKMLLAFLLFSVGSIYAQSGSIKLKLVDSLTQAPVDFASVYVSKDGTVKGVPEKCRFVYLVPKHVKGVLRSVIF